VVEELNWSDDALLPRDLFSFQEFRDLFSEQYIGADVQLEIGEQTIVFTDIVGSTRLYIDRGDPEAFVAVRHHFAEVFAIVNEHEGAVVKTIGDATMAAFSQTTQALRAAKRMHDAFRDRSDTPVRLRVSVNRGTCIAVNLNSNIDYFGHTVNFAAKLQLAGGAGEIVVSDAVYGAPGVAELCAELGARFESLSLDVGGSDANKVWRWSTYGEARVEGRKLDAAG
jgi:class 3 adenylate cyclase